MDSERLQGAGLKELAIEELAGLGDEAFAYSASAPGVSERYRGVDMRIGTYVAMMEVVAPGIIDASMVDALARAQVTCLLEGCLEPLPVPADLVP